MWLKKGSQVHHWLHISALNRFKPFLLLWMMLKMHSRAFKGDAGNSFPVCISSKRSALIWAFPPASNFGKVSQDLLLGRCQTWCTTKKGRKGHNAWKSPWKYTKGSTYRLLSQGSPLITTEFNIVQAYQSQGDGLLNSKIQISQHTDTIPLERLQKLFAQSKTNQTKDPAQPKVQHDDVTARPYHPAGREESNYGKCRVFSYCFYKTWADKAAMGQTHQDPVSTRNVAQEDHIWFLWDCRAVFAGVWRWIGLTAKPSAVGTDYWRVMWWGRTAARSILPPHGGDACLRFGDRGSKCVRLSHRYQHCKARRAFDGLCPSPAQAFPQQACPSRLVGSTKTSHLGKREVKEIRRWVLSSMQLWRSFLNSYIKHF